MIQTIKGKVVRKETDFVLVEAGSFGFKIFTNPSTIQKTPLLGNEVKFFCSLYFKEDKFYLYGFLSEKDRSLFEMLNSVSGVGPKSSLSILGSGTSEQIISAIVEKKPDLLSKGKGVGKKMAEKIVLELHNKLTLSGSKDISEKMGVDADVEEALVSLGYSRKEAKSAVSHISSKSNDLETRLKEALKIIAKK